MAGPSLPTPEPPLSATALYLVPPGNVVALGLSNMGGQVNGKQSCVCARHVSNSVDTLTGNLRWRGIGKVMESRGERALVPGSRSLGRGARSRRGVAGLGGKGGDEKISGSPERLEEGSLPGRVGGGRMPRGRPAAKWR